MGDDDETDMMQRGQEGTYWPDGGVVELIGDDVEQQPANLGGASSSRDDKMEWAGGGAPVASVAEDDENVCPWQSWEETSRT